MRGEQGNCPGNPANRKNELLPNHRVSRVFWGYFIFFSLGFVFIPPLTATEKWHRAYANGQAAISRGDWKAAVTHFSTALEQKNFDTGKTRAYGAVFIEYFPNREIGICYFHLNDLERARRHLQLSLQQSQSARAREYLSRINTGQAAPPPAPPPATVTVNNEARPPDPTTMLVGDRLSIAILPFVAKGLGGELGEIDLLDKLTTVFVNLNRFKVIERAQLEKILEEQKLGLTGIVDASTAAQIGKNIGVDAVVCGSIVRAGNSASIDARLVDTETAAIITAKDAYSNGLSLAAMSQMISEAASKIKNDLPMVSGYVIQIEGERLTLDLGRVNNIRKGMRCHIYREGEPIVHPVTNQVIGKAIVEISEVQLIEVFDSYSIATITKSKNGAPQVRDRVITK